MNNVQILVHPCPVLMRSSHEECWLSRKLLDPGVGGINENGKGKKGREREKKGGKGWGRKNKEGEGRGMGEDRVRRERDPLLKS